MFATSHVPMRPVHITIREAGERRTIRRQVPSRQVQRRQALREQGWNR